MNKVDTVRTSTSLDIAIEFISNLPHSIENTQFSQHVTKEISTTLQQFELSKDDIHLEKRENKPDIPAANITSTTESGKQVKVSVIGLFENETDVFNGVKVTISVGNSPLAKRGISTTITPGGNRGEPQYWMS